MFKDLCLASLTSSYCTFSRFGDFSSHHCETTFTAATEQRHHSATGTCAFATGALAAYPLSPGCNGPALGSPGLLQQPPGDNIRSCFCWLSSPQSKYPNPCDRGAPVSVLPPYLSLLSLPLSQYISQDLHGTIVPGLQLLSP